MVGVVPGIALGDGYDIKTESLCKEMALILNVIALKSKSVFEWLSYL